ncbi:hypothetical protein KDA_60180 [Dictyobacter alpinus]|uniref:Cytochrome b561 domain-containing protein n=1 Tax=Dictyobacter alpinus TaxID=2014873 RepID=A0A402BGJ5_9CHLR|nr:hypothetical protein [Dictyobacter alpinus]GCE30534.1 hypothetical protein KDA_60180 [Dictyobacter alpinus]
MTTRIIQIIVGIAGLAALTLGLLYWIANINLANIHMLFGLLVAITLLVMSSIAVSTRALRLQGIIGIIYALLVPVFGLTQSTILPGSLHWLIQTAHMLVGIGAMLFTGWMATRYKVLKQPTTQSDAATQFARSGSR